MTSGTWLANHGTDMSPTSVLCQLMTRRVKPGHLWKQQCPGGPVPLITLLPVLLTSLLLSDLQEHWGPTLLILSYLIFCHVATDKRSLGHGTYGEGWHNMGKTPFLGKARQLQIVNYTMWDSSRWLNIFVATNSHWHFGHSTPRSLLIWKYLTWFAISRGWISL